MKLKFLFGSILASFVTVGCEASDNYSKADVISEFYDTGDISNSTIQNYMASFSTSSCQDVGFLTDVVGFKLVYDPDSLGTITKSDDIEKISECPERFDLGVLLLIFGFYTEKKLPSNPDTFLRSIDIDNIYQAYFFRKFAEEDICSTKFQDIIFDVKTYLGCGRLGDVITILENYRATHGIGIKRMDGLFQNLDQLKVCTKTKSSCDAEITTIEKELQQIKFFVSHKW